MGIRLIATILTACFLSRDVPVARSFFHSELGTRQLGGGLVAWRGYYQSLRPTQSGLSLNLGTAST